MDNLQWSQQGLKTGPDVKNVGIITMKEVDQNSYTCMGVSEICSKHVDLVATSVAI